MNIIINNNQVRRYLFHHLVSRDDVSAVSAMSRVCKGLHFSITNDSVMFQELRFRLFPGINLTSNTASLPAREAFISVWKFYQSQLKLYMEYSGESRHGVCENVKEYLVQRKELNIIVLAPNFGVDESMEDLEIHIEKTLEWAANTVPIKLVRGDLIRSYTVVSDTPERYILSGVALRLFNNPPTFRRIQELYLPNYYRLGMYSFSFVRAVCQSGYQETRVMITDKLFLELKNILAGDKNCKLIMFKLPVYPIPKFGEKLFQKFWVRRMFGGKLIEVMRTQSVFMNYYTSEEESAGHEIQLAIMT